MKCEICGKEILRDSQCINYKYYHNDCIENLQQENEQLSKEIDVWNKKYNDMFDENKQLKDLIDTILNFSLFKEECPLNFEFDNNTNEDKSQSIFYEEQWCENNCNDNYKDCWLKYFKKLQELERSENK